MKTDDILLAIKALDEARSSLNCGMDSIARQMQIARDCSLASFHLREELVREHPDVAIERAA